MSGVIVALVSGTWFLQVGLVIAALVGSSLALRRLRGRVGPGRPGRMVALTGQHALHVVELDGRRMVIGTGPSGAPQFVCDLGPEAADHGD